MHKCSNDKRLATVSEACSCRICYYALFLENERKRQLLEQEERKKEQAEETQWIKEKARSAVLEQLKEQEKLEESQLQEQKQPEN